MKIKFPTGIEIEGTGEELKIFFSSSKTKKQRGRPKKIKKNLE